MKFAALASAVLAAPLLFALGIATLAGAQPAHGSAASEEALADIPTAVLPVYVAAAETCPGLSWAVVAAVGKVESNHGRNGDAVMLPNGDVEPWIIGIALDGRPGVRAIRDTDGGRWDRDTVWDRAVGPMQFIPSTWRRYGMDATGSGQADPHNLIDAAYSAAGYLCANGAGDPARLRSAILAYNHADWYADQVLSIAARYASPLFVGGEIVGGYALPVAREWLSIPLIRRPHHDYPAWDIALPVGTPVYAAHGGTVVAVTDGGRCGGGVVIAGLDGARYTYCHADRVLTARGQDVAPGELILLSGNTGRSTGPHLHFQINNTLGQLVCPQPLLEAWFQGRPVTPETAPTSGCIS